MAVPITALFAGVNAIFNIALAFDVTRNRGNAKIFLGTGQSPELLLASRRHGNNAEYVPLALVLMLVVELGAGSPMALYAIGGMLTLGRLAHAIGVGPEPKPLRVVGALLTWLSIVGAGVYALMQALG